MVWLVSWFGVALVMPGLDGSSAAVETKSSGLEIVQQFVATFNDHDVDAMMNLVTEDVEWFNINGSKMSVETSGVAALRKGMTGYFVGVPTVRSHVVKSMVSGSFVTIQERVSWTQAEKQRSQASLAVYELRGGLIRRVWYYPAEK
jgi:hypothetical protein